MFTDQDKEIKIALQVLKCIKCDTYDNLISYPISKVYKSSLDKNKEKKSRCKNFDLYFIPICKRCDKEFQRCKRFKSKYKKKIVKNVIYFILSFLLVWGFIHNFIIQILLAIIIAGIITIEILLVLKKLRKMEGNPRKYINLKNDGSLYVKQKDFSSWISFRDWLKECIYERIYINECKNIALVKHAKFDFINCVYCGAKVRTIDLKCFKCGKLLPMV